MKIFGELNKIEISLLKLFIIGFLMRLIFMPIAVHPDLLHTSWQSHYISLGYLNIYQYFLEHYPQMVLNGEMSYFPPIFYIYGIWEFILSHLGLLNISNWSWNPDDVFRTYQIDWNMDLIFSNSSIFLLKIIYLPFDLAIGYLLLKLVDAKDRWLTYALWMLNPVIIFIAYIWGQFDIITAFFVVLALYYAKKSTLLNGGDYIDSNAIISVIAIGASVCFRSFALFILPAFIIILSNRDLIKSLKLGILGMAPAILFIVPFITTPAFFQSVFNTWQNDKLFALSLNLGEAHNIYLFFLLFMFALVYLIYVDKRSSFNSLWQYSFVFLSIFYMTVEWHPHWYLLMMPFLILAIAKNNKLMDFYIFVTAFFFLYTLGGGVRNGTGLFYPIAPMTSILLGLPDIIPPYDKLIGIAYSAFVVLSLAAIYSMFKEGSDKQESIQARGSPLVYGNLKLAAPVVVLLIALLSSLSFGSQICLGINQSMSDGVSPDIMGNITVGQTFVSDYSGLYGIEVFPIAGGRINDERIAFHLINVSSSRGQIEGKEATTYWFNASDIKDNESLLLAFPSLTDSGGKRYGFYLESENSSKTEAIKLSLAENGTYKYGTWVLNGREMAKGDLKFRTYYRAGISEVLSSMGNVHRDLKDSIFMTLYLMTIIILTGLLAVLHYWGRNRQTIS